MTLAEEIRTRQRAVAAAKEELDRAADDMASALLPRLRLLSSHRLKALKAALQGFDAHRGIWK